MPIAMTRSPGSSASESPKRCRRRIAWTVLQSNQGTVRERIAAEDVSRVGLAIVAEKPHANLLRTGHDVIVGQDLAVAE